MYQMAIQYVCRYKKKYIFFVSYMCDNINENSNLETIKDGRLLNQYLYMD